MPIMRSLMDNPLRWYVVHHSETRGAAMSVALNLRRGRATVPPGRWEFVSRGTKVYGRYVGVAS